MERDVPAPGVFATVIVLEFFSDVDVVTCFSRFCGVLARVTASALNMQTDAMKTKARIFFISGVNFSKIMKNIASKNARVYNKK